MVEKINSIRICMMTLIIINVVAQKNEQGTQQVIGNIGSLFPVNFESSIGLSFPQNPFIQEPTIAYGQITINQEGVHQAQLYSPNCA